MGEVPAPGRSTGPLAGVRVLDLGQYISGPCATVLLAELGADVVKVEPPGGDAFRHWDASKLGTAIVAYNRGKSSVVLDLKEPHDREQLLRLAAAADVLVENFRPGVTQRLGIDYPTVRQVNDRLIYCSITGFGPTGPRANLPAFDGVAMGYSGLASMFLDQEDLRVPGPAMSDAITAHSAALSIVSALYARPPSGGGCHVELSMFGSLLHFLHSQVTKWVVDGKQEGPYTRSHGSQTYVFAGRDAKLLLIHLSSPDKFWRGLCSAVGREDLIEDPRYAAYAQRRDSYEILRAELTPAFAQRERDEWLEILQRFDVPCAPVNTIGEALADPQLDSLGTVEAYEEPGIGPMPQIRAPSLWDGAPLPPIRRTPFLGEHTAQLLGDERSESEVSEWVRLSSSQ